MATATEQEPIVDVEALNASAKIAKVNLDDLQVDMSYQREITQTLVDKLVAEWSVVASELILVSDRGERDEESGVKGGLFVVNGQHRSNAAKKKGLKRVDARIIDLSEFADPGKVEAQFRLETNVRINDKPTERFRAQVRAGHERSLKIVSLLEDFDTEINRQYNPEMGINTVSAIERLWEVDQGGLLREVLQVIKEAWGTVGGKNVTVPILNAIAWFVLQHDSSTDRQRLVEKLRETGYAAIDRRGRTTQATMSGSLWVNYYRVLVELYNERLRASSRIEWKTRGAGSWKGKSESWGKGE